MSSSYLNRPSEPGVDEGDSFGLESGSFSGPGSFLKRHREQFGLSVADVAARLNLRYTVIEAIERDDYQPIAKLVFVRGYLRAYAKMLNLSSNDIIQAFNKLNLPESNTNAYVCSLRDGQRQAPRRLYPFVSGWRSIILGLLIITIIIFWGPLSAYFNTVVTTPGTSQHTMKASQTTKTPQATQQKAPVVSTLPNIGDLDSW